MNILHFLIGIATGIISGFGIGGGSILVLYLTAVQGVRQLNAGGINLLYFIGCAPIALVGHIKNRYVNWRVVLPCVLAGVLVALPVSAWANGIDNDWLRRMFGIVLFYVGIKEICASKDKKKSKQQ